MPDFSLNAIGAKARAKFGKRLKSRQYLDLIDCFTVGEAAMYLKTNTAYAPVLEEIHYPSAHRGRLEELLSRKQFEDFSSLCAFEFSGSGVFYRIIILKEEIRQILRCVRLLAYGREDEYLFTMPAFFDRQTDISLMELAKCDSFKGIIKVVSGTAFEKMLRPFDLLGVMPDFTAMETVLYKYYTDFVFETIGKTERGRAKEELLDFFYLQVELDNVKRILRLKNGFEASEDYIRSCLMPNSRYIKSAELEKMLKASNGEEVLSLFGETYYGRRLTRRGNPVDPKNFSQMIYDESVKTIYYSTNPNAVLAAYTVVAEIELSNVINIIEGIRYKINPAEIKKMLIPILE